MKNYGKFYSYSEMATMPLQTLIDIFSDGDVPKETREMACVVLETRNTGF